MRNLSRIGLAVVLGAAAIALGWTVEHRRKPAQTKPAVAAPSVFQGSEITLTGRLQSRSTQQVEAPIAGILDAWFVTVGQEVYEDQLVGRIRNADLDNGVLNAQAAVDRAEIRIAQLDAQAAAVRLEGSRTTADQIRARNELERIEKIYLRYKNLMEAGALARLTFEKTEADYNAAKSELAARDAAAKDAQDKAAALQRDSEEAKRALADLTGALANAKDAVARGDLHSPADGVVLSSELPPGAQVEAAQKNLLTIATDLANLAVWLSPDPSVLARIRAGQHVSVRMAGGEYPGEVHELRGHDVIVEFSAPDPVTQLGTAAQVRIVF